MKRTLAYMAAIGLYGLLGAPGLTPGVAIIAAAIIWSTIGRRDY